MKLYPEDVSVINKMDSSQPVICISAQPIPSLYFYIFHRDLLYNVGIN
jgi:hypothetical protein